MSIKTKCGGTIEISERTLQHLAAHTDVIEFLPDAIGRVRLPASGGMLEATVDMGRIIGRSGLVQAPAVSLTDSAWFAKRTGRDHPSRVMHCAGEDTNNICVIARPSKRPGAYFLVSAWLGRRAVKEPWDRNLQVQDRSESIAFWSRYALSYDPKVMDKPFESTWEAVLAGVASGGSGSRCCDRRS